VAGEGRGVGSGLICFCRKRGGYVLRAVTFKGGIHPPARKDSSGSAIKELPPPERVVIPLQQHIGAPCEPLVEKGDTVKAGQKIGDTDAFVSAPVHSSVSGRVTGIEPVPGPAGKGQVQAVAIAVDGESARGGAVVKGTRIKSLETASADKLRGIIREAGIVGLGGATFPTHVKLTPPSGKEVETVILNGCECEPFLTADDRLMMEDGSRIVRGLAVICKILAVKRAVIAIEDNKPQAIASMQAAVCEWPGKKEVEVRVQPVVTKYPQGAEKQLIDAILDVEVPAGGLPVDVGVIVHNVGTAAAIADAVFDGLALTRRVVTVAGKGVAEPGNFLVALGTPFAEVIKAAGGYTSAPVKVIMGGPMMGISQYTDEVPVVKGTSGILVLTAAEARGFVPGSCIKCGRCVDVCPTRLLPNFIHDYAELGRWEEARDLGALNCIECGSCSYVCPAHRHLLEWIRVAKGQIQGLSENSA